MARRNAGYWDAFRPSKPIAAKGGVKSQSKRGAFGSSWWAKRWIAVLEGLEIGGRLSRGRSYARKGQVLSIAVGKGRVKAEVQGSRSQPYRVEIEVKELSQDAWKKLAEVLSRQAVFVAKLLVGEMPEQIEDAFRETELSLFPETQGDLVTSCSCPDYANPCKHVAAVYYLLGEEFDRDPFLILKLRGIEQEELVALVGSPPAGAAEPPEPLPDKPLPPEPLPADPAEFWGHAAAAPGAEEDLGEVRIPSVTAALPRRLGSFPFWRGTEDFLPWLEEVYRQASPAGMAVFLLQSRADDE
jgi:uncharacterized Zn finger protein